MFEDSVATIPSLWASMNSWLTPAVLFVLLNVMIGTIAFTSTLANQNKHHHPSPHHDDDHHQNHNQQQQQQQQQQHQNLSISRSPSLLQRVRSINFYSYRSQQPNLATGGNLSSTNTTSTATNFKISPDSDTLYDFEHTHQREALENSSHYAFDRPQVGSQRDDAHFFHQHVEANGEESHTHYFFEQTHEEKARESDSGYQFEGENETKFDEDHNIDGNDDDDDGLQSLDEVYSKLTGRHVVSRTKSDTEPSSGEIPARLPAKIRKSASMKSPFGHFEADYDEVVSAVEARRPATVRERGVAREPNEAEEEVDARADDFINKFKQQLKLQRLDSIIRYKDMITEGSGRK